VIKKYLSYINENVNPNDPYNEEQWENSDINIGDTVELVDNINARWVHDFSFFIQTHLPIGSQGKVTNKGMTNEGNEIIFIEFGSGFDGYYNAKNFKKVI